MDRFRGVRVVDISDIAHPRVVTNVQTCRGSHTNTLARIATVRTELMTAEGAIGGARTSALSATAAALTNDITGAADSGRVQLLQRAVLSLSKAK